MSDPKEVQIPATIPVKDLSEKLSIQVTQLIGFLMKNGIMATINESLDFETASIIAAEFGYTTVLDHQKAEIKPDANAGELAVRVPVVTIMGHVDHGKTTLLDTLRQSNVAGGESGGITQHIGAYQVTVPKTVQHKTNTITFLDTPGHAAFTAMRQHGANITDIVVLVIAANDGIKAQTIEALDNAKQAKVPIIVAITKIDLPDANLDRIKQQLAEVDMVPEEWGGQTVIVPVSAKTKQGLPELLEMILLVADLAELKANFSGRALGVVIESHMEPGKGPMATVLVQNGKLAIADPVAAGATFGKVRTLENYRGDKIEFAGPSEPVRVSGFRAVPNFGEQVRVMVNEKEAREYAQNFSQARGNVKVHTMQGANLEDAVSDETGEQRELPVVIKADVKGSLEAVKKVLQDLGTNEVSIRITNEGVGPVGESDITMARATKSSILAFRVPSSVAIRNLALQEKVLVTHYDIIYDLVEDVKKALSKLLPHEIVEIPTGKAKVIALFKGDKRGRVVGVQVEEGVIATNATFHLMRGKKLIADSTVQNVRREKSEVKEATSGQQAGILVPADLEVAVDDIIETYRTENRARSL